MFPHLKNFNLEKWIEENRHDWGQRRRIWEDSDFLASVTRGPNSRSEFHIDPGDEIFYQLEGELNLHYITNEGNRDLTVIQAGELFLLPANVPHSPRRGEGSWTFVVERKRRPGTARSATVRSTKRPRALMTAQKRSSGPMMSLRLTKSSAPVLGAAPHWSCNRMAEEKR